jgi:hypothetical protein
MGKGTDNLKMSFIFLEVCLKILVQTNYVGKQQEENNV